MGAPCVLTHSKLEMSVASPLCWTQQIQMRIAFLSSKSKDLKPQLFRDSYDIGGFDFSPIFGSFHEASLAKIFAKFRFWI